jgi:hypothetical protein
LKAILNRRCFHHFIDPYDPDHCELSGPNRETDSGETTFGIIRSNPIQALGNGFDEGKNDLTAAAPQTYLQFGKRFLDRQQVR